MRYDWYKRNPSDFRMGSRGLPPMVRLLYMEVIDLIYEYNGKLPNDDRFLATALQTDVRQVRANKAKLIELGKLIVTADGRLSNRRCEIELRARGSLEALPPVQEDQGANTPGSVPDHSDITQGSLGDHSDITLTSLGDHSDITRGSLAKSPMISNTISIDKEREKEEEERDSEVTPLTPQGGAVVAFEKAPELPIAAPPAAVAPVKRPRLNTAPAYSGDFEAVWREFPKNPNSSKQDAFKAWGKIPAAERAAVLPAAQAYAARMAKERDPKICHLSTFLNKGLFRNDADAFGSPVAASQKATGGVFAHLEGLSRAQWAERIKRFANGVWPATELGPPPASKHCIVPRDLINELELADKYNSAGFAINAHDPKHPANLHKGAVQ